MMKNSTKKPTPIVSKKSQTISTTQFKKTSMTMHNYAPNSNFCIRLLLDPGRLSSSMTKESVKLDRLLKESGKD